MKISKRLEYGLDFLLALGLRWPDYSTVAEIAERNQSPHKFLEAVASDLRKAGLVDVKRGSGGGYRLAIAIKEISLLDVLSALEPEWRSVERRDNNVSQTEKALNHFLEEAQTKIHQTASQISLSQLIDEYRKNNVIMYHI